MRILAVLAAICLFIACAQPDERITKLYGNWQGVSWNEGGVDRSANAASVSYSFSEDGTYSSTINGTTAQGTFDFVEGKLTVNPVGEDGKALPETYSQVKSVDNLRLVIALENSTVEEVFTFERR